jgi:hypothetical protein
MKHRKIFFYDFFLPNAMIGKISALNFNVSSVSNWLLIAKNYEFRFPSQFYSNSNGYFETLMRIYDNLQKN